MEQTPWMKEYLLPSCVDLGDLIGWCTAGLGESMCRGWAGAPWDPTGGVACSGLCGKSFYLSERGCERYISSGCMAGET